MKKILDLGCSGRKYPRAIGLDKTKSLDVDVVHDLNKFPYPFKKNTFDKVHASHILEHLDDAFKAMEEIHRICKPNAILIIRVPHFSSVYAHSIVHKQFFWTKDIELHFSGDRRYSKCKYEVKEKRLCYFMKSYGEHPQRTTAWWAKVVKPLAGIIDYFANANQTFCERVWCYWVGGFGEIYFKLKVIK